MARDGLSRPSLQHVSRMVPSFSSLHGHAFRTKTACKGTWKSTKNQGKVKCVSVKYFFINTLQCVLVCGNGECSLVCTLHLCCGPNSLLPHSKSLCANLLQHQREMMANMDSSGDAFGNSRVDDMYVPCSVYSLAPVATKNSRSSPGCMAVKWAVQHHHL